MKTFLALMFVCGAALADDGAILRCRQLPDGPQRLACYNAIAVPSHPALPVAPAAAPAAPAKDVVTSIAGPFEGWIGGQVIRLANGQAWRVVDGSEDVLSLRDPKVTIQRGMLGATFLDIEGAHRSPRVQLVR